MDFSYAQLGGVPSGDAYARLIDDCIQGDPTLFTRSDAVEASWKFFDPVLRYWKDNPMRLFTVIPQVRGDLWKVKQ